MRLDKYICDSLNITRTQAKSKISSGAVFVNGVSVRSSSTHIDENSACVCVEGKRISYNKYVYIMMNKPAGVLSATKDGRGKTAIDLLDPQDKRHDLFIAGRLDKDTTGFLLITNDGDFAHSILSPKKHIFKTYIVTLEHNDFGGYQTAFENGIRLEDGTICKPALFKALYNNVCELKICEGKFHQIKRMFESLGNKVVALSRVAMDELMLDKTLGEGQYRHLTEQEKQNFVYKITKNNQ